MSVNLSVTITAKSPDKVEYYYIDNDTGDTWRREINYGKDTPESIKSKISEPLRRREIELVKDFWM